MGKRIDWSDFEIKVLNDMYESEPKRDKILELLNKKNWPQVITKCSSIGLKRPKSFVTKQALEKQFWDYYKQHGVYPKAFDLRGVNYIHYKHYQKQYGSYNDFLKAIGLINKETTDGWLKEDEELLKKHYPLGELEQIGKNLIVKRDMAGIKDKASKMGIKINKEVRYTRKYKNEDVRNQLAAFAKDFYRTHNRSPYKFELPLNKHAVNENWDSYNEFLEYCDLPTPRRTPLANDSASIIAELQNMKSKLDRNPTIDEMDDYGIPKSTFDLVFGGYRNALFSANLISKIEIDEEYKLNLSIEAFKSLFKELGKCPIYEQYSDLASRNKLFHPNKLAEKLGCKKYTDLCVKLVGVSNIEEWSKEEMIQDLKDLKEKLGRVPQGKDLAENGYTSYYNYKERFGVRYFNDIIKSLGWEPYGHDPRYRSDQELLDDFLLLYNALGRVPTSEDLNRDENTAIAEIYKERLGSIQKICETLGLDHTTMYSDMSIKSGVMCFDKKGDLCRSLNEKYITDAFIDSEIDYIKEPTYGSAFGNNDKRRFDWYLPSSNTYVEYFGMYDERRKDSDCRVGIYTRKCLKKIDDCKNNEVKLIAVYPHTIDNFLRDISKVKIT